MTSLTDRYISIDEEGYFALDGRRVDDPELGRELLQNLKILDGGRVVTASQGQEAWVESFDEPLLGRHITLENAHEGNLELAYGAKARFDFASLSVDEWDRFHGVTTIGVPFVLSRQAQVEFFDLLDEFSDDSVTIKGRRIEVGPWLKPFADSSRESFWSDIYRNEEPRWDLKREHPALAEVLPQLKLSRAKILVLGCGRGHDAAFLARAGHLVTAVDLSSEAVADARKLYGDVENLQVVQSDVFSLPDSWSGTYDLVFEHTCYCAITPERRDELARVWKRVLIPRGRLLGIFFVHPKREGPPFGGSEWEVRERLRKDFQFLYWTRWRRSPETRRGAELMVFAQKFK